MEAIGLADDAQQEIDKIRSNDEIFKNIFEDAKSLAESLDISVKLTRIQMIGGLPIEKYFRVKLFYEFLDFYQSELKERFINHKKMLIGFQAIFHASYSEKDLQETFEFYEEFLECPPSAAVVETRMWKQYLTRKNIVPKNVTDAIDMCPKNTFPNVNTLLKILATLPVSTSTAERTFSCMKRIKTYLRNSIGQVIVFT